MITNQGENNNGLSPYSRGTFLYFYVMIGQNGLSSLSPCLRGIRRLPVLFPAVMQFIPVPTGNTTFLSVRTAIMTVYPRAYGEHLKRKQIVRSLAVH
ncbi:hypothetical protein [Xenorhabdus sp. IM139775]|uniref:hypothetical protein n=1 Tax=Xenorhabdus sp. IM139775 TaxID=3025876 RepID=UPI0023587EF0|nr:hypothetical protein [Xenorhabdus sp. IM139775]MDC9594027.1 hypothetical protein [Xenorhabdus sp. IM139775]